MSASRIRRGSNRSSASKRGAPVHGHLGAEPPVAEVRPVADLAVAHADDVAQAVAGHVGGEDRSGCRRPGRRRAPSPRPSGVRTMLRAAEARSRPARRTRVNSPSSVIRMSASPSPVTSMNVTFGSDQSSSGSAGEPAQRLEARVGRPLEEARRRARPATPRRGGRCPTGRAAGRRTGRSATAALATVSSGPSRPGRRASRRAAATRLPALRFRL